MVNWQKYDKQVSLTRYRLHAQFTEEKPAEPLGTTLLGAIRVADLSPASFTPS